MSNRAVEFDVPEDQKWWSDKTTAVVTGGDFPACVYSLFTLLKQGVLPRAVNKVLLLSAAQATRASAGTSAES